MQVIVYPFIADNQEKRRIKLKNYELLTIFKPNLDAEEIEKNILKIKEAIANYKGKIIDIDKIGRKKLAYEIQNFRDGFFVSQTLNLPEDKISDFKRQLKLNDNILRIMFLEITKKVVTK